MFDGIPYTFFEVDDKIDKEMELVDEKIALKQDKQVLNCSLVKFRLKATKLPSVSGSSSSFVVVISVTIDVDTGP